MMRPRLQRTAFPAELHHLEAVAQVDNAVTVLSRVSAPRAAPEEDVMPDAASRGPLWRCRVLHGHDFVPRSTLDGGRYEQCRGIDCGSISDLPTTTPPARGPL